MSFVVSVKGCDGIVLATDTRQLWRQGGDGARYATWDGAKKLLTFPEPHTHVGAVLYGLDPSAATRVLDGTWLATLAAGLPARRLPVRDYAEHVARVLGADAARWAERVAETETARMLFAMPAPSPYLMTGIVAGHDEDGEARVYVVEIPDRPEPVEQHVETLGITYGGMREHADRLLQGHDARLHEFLVDGVDGLDSMQMQLRLSTFSLETCAEFAEFLVRTTISAQKFIAGLSGAGGGVEVATLTAADGLRVIRSERQADAPVVLRDVGVADAGTVVAPADGIQPAGFTVRG